MKLDFLREFDFFTGVPDSQLKPLVDYLLETYGISEQHIIAANEGSSVALAAGYYLATGKIPVVYLQNSGIGHIVNPVASLMNEQVYGIPCVFIVGWRGEPGVADEPQHVFQGETTVALLEEIGIKTFILRKETTDEEVKTQMDDFREWLSAGKQVAFVVCKSALSFEGNGQKAETQDALLREEILRHIVEAAGDDIIVSTTGKASRELFEIREAKKQGHSRDFLTVGSMGHSSSIALSIALQQKEKRIWCVDGDGAALMHMGAMAVIGANQPQNLVHIVINNGAHETVGGAPTVAQQIDLRHIAQGCGYQHIRYARSAEELTDVLQEVRAKDGLWFVEILSRAGSRKDLGRPTTTPKQNKEAFMERLQG